MVVVRTFLPVLTSRAGGAGLFEDDSYFYAQIAYNLGVHGISSFDGINVTNGFHLLWGHLLALVTWGMSALTLDKTQHLVAMLGLYLGVGLGTAVAFGRNTIEHFILFAAVAFTSMLMESALLAALLLVVLSEMLREQRRIGLLEVALFLLPLTRIDSILFVPGILAIPLSERRFRSVARIAVPVALGVLAQLAWSKLAYGELFSVSAKLKMGGGLSMTRLLEGLARPYAATAFVAFGVTTFQIFKTSPSAERRRALFLMSSLGCFFGTHLLANADGLRDWYMVPIFAGSAYLAFRMLPRRSLRVSYAVFGFLLGGLGFMRGALVAYFAPEVAYSRGFLDKANAALPPGRKVYQIDGAGYTGYFTHAAIINGDGLVNSYAYAERLKSNSLAGYLKENGIRYIIMSLPTAVGTPVVDFHGLVVPWNHVRVVLSPPEGLRRPVAYTLYELLDSE
jgi:hypothetical protein